MGDWVVLRKNSETGWIQNTEPAVLKFEFRY